MKIFLLLTWLLIGGAGYYAYNFYQQSLADTRKLDQDLDTANASNADLAAKIAALAQQVAVLQTQLDDEKKRLIAPPPPPPVAPAPTSPARSLTPTSLPTTITTVYGKTYTGCVLSRVMPDGISFTHSEGVAKVLFSDLDPAFASTFGYDPATARKYEQDQATQEAQSDALRSASDAAAAKAASVATAAAAAQASANQTAAKAASNQSQIASLQAQIASLQSDAQSADARAAADFNSPNNIYYNSEAQVEHHQTMGHSQQADQDRAQIQVLQGQIAQLHASH